MAFSDFITVNITATSVGVTQAGFGVPLILGTPSWPSERIRFYTDITGVAADFATTRPEYLAANAIFSQSPRPPRIAIGRLALKPTQKRTITPTAVNSAVYEIRINDETYSYTADASATAAEIVAGLLALINAGSADHNLTASGTTTLVLTADNAGDWDDVEVLDTALLSLEQDHADPGVATDLAAIKTIDNTWYAIINPWNSEAMALAIAAWAESNTKLFICATQDTPVANVAEGSADDVMKQMKTAAYVRTFPLYHGSNGEFLDAALAGRVLPLDPGSETWAYKTLAGVSASTLTSTQRTNITNKSGTYYVEEAGVNVTLAVDGAAGQVSSGEWVDVVRFRDWIVARIGERTFSLLVNNAKIGYTDAGIAAIAGAVRSVLKDGKAVGGLDSFDVIVGKVADADPADKTARRLRLVNFTADLAGAVHAATINGSVG